MQAHACQPGNQRVQAPRMPRGNTNHDDSMTVTVMTDMIAQWMKWYQLEAWDSHHG